MRAPRWKQTLSKATVFAALFAALVAGCAAPSKLSPSEQPQWSGRLSIKIDATEGQSPQQTSAAFTLMGDAAAGQLHLFTPLGTQAAQVVWGSNFATISDGKTQRNFSNLAAALQQITGADLPVSSLFNWLQGNQDKAREASQGWEADTTSLSAGRIVATRLQPLPRIELRVVLAP